MLLTLATVLLTSLLPGARTDTTFSVRQGDRLNVSNFGGEIVVPVNTNVIVSVTSLDVIHSFKVLAMRVTQDAIPGMRIPIHFKPTKTNTYQINCAQLCGVGHSLMKGYLKVVPPAEFEAWLKSKAGAAPASFE